MPATRRRRPPAFTPRQLPYGAIAAWWTRKNGVWADRAPTLNGSSQCYSVASNSSVQTGDVDFWLAAWVNLSSKSVTMGIAAKGNPYSSPRIEYFLAYDVTSNRFFLQVGNGGSSWGIVYANDFGSPPTSTWCLLFARSDRAANRLYISVNGGAENSSSTLGFTPGTTTDPFRVGSLETSGSPSNYLAGQVGAVALGKSPSGGFATTTPAYIRDLLYQGGRGVYADTLSSSEKTAIGLVSSWRLNGDGADSHGSNTLTANGTPTYGSGLVCQTPATLGGTVGVWGDQGPLRLRARNTTSTQLPTLESAGVTFSSASSQNLFTDAIAYSSLWGADESCVMALVKYTAAGKGGLFSHIGGDNSNSVHVNCPFDDNTIYFRHGDSSSGGSVSVAAPSNYAGRGGVVEFRRKGTRGEIWVNGAMLTAGTFSDNLDSLSSQLAFYLGRHLSYYWDGAIAELLVLKTLDGGHIRQVRDYLTREGVAL